MHSVFFSQRFLPEFGGSISWLCEILNNWQEPYTLISHNYQTGKHEISSNKVAKTEHIRANLLMSDWGLCSCASFKKYWRAGYLLYKQMSVHQAITAQVFHILPEGLPVAILKFLYPKTKLVAYVHGEELLAYRSSRELSLLVRFILPRVDRFICNSLNTKLLLTQLFPSVDLTRVEVIHPSINLEIYQPALSRAALRVKYGFGVDSKILISVARLSKRKNQQQVLLALQKLKTEIGNLHYILVGSGPELEELQQQVKQLELESQVRFFLNFNDQQKLELLQLSDLFVLPTVAAANDIEGFGIAFIEAQAVGLPVICGKSGGEAEAVINSQTGYVIDGQDLDLLTESIKKLLSSAELYSELSHNARLHGKQFDSQLQTQKITKSIRALHDRI